jgi:hypothetical protein
MNEEREKLVDILGLRIVRAVYTGVSMGHSKEEVLREVGLMLGSIICQLSEETKLTPLEILRRLVSVSASDSVIHMICEPILTRLEHSPDPSLN